MPGRRTSSRQVGFAPVEATYSRLPRDDEAYVMKAFAKHSAHCTQCSDPYKTHLKGGSLCAKGTRRAQDVADYVINKAGLAFSVVDLEQKHKRIQVEIPADCSAVRDLLKAMERGLRLQSSKPIESYDKHYYVPSRRQHKENDLEHELESSHSSSPRRHHDDDYEPIAPKSKGKAPARSQSTRHHQRPQSTHIPSNHHRQPNYYTIAPQGVAPVPAYSYAQPSYGYWY
ncbi:uncharacterized protein KY384_002797 [Bacidia gigantensis]|uniref:uncharacterized protein n=1 Tax=Bacidia gigantensis TaxID=2732470 RepID=UPI001D0589C1|nr:uncharacterized protein KY384_002797 [Bacidia gigantensis]KAG8532919.1 hypothetical protein KY384_002797 [Bacidia gigantensis]